MRMKTKDVEFTSGVGGRAPFIPMKSDRLPSYKITRISCSAHRAEALETSAD